MERKVFFPAKPRRDGGLAERNSATSARHNTVASEYIPSKIGPRIEITCLAVGRYCFNSITCFLFVRRFRSHGTVAGIGSFFFPARSHISLIPSDQVGLVAVKVLCFTRTGTHRRHGRVLHVLPDGTAGGVRGGEAPDRRNPLIPRRVRSRGKGEIFESDDEPFSSATRPALSRVYRVAIHQNWRIASIKS